MYLRSGAEVINEPRALLTFWKGLLYNISIFRALRVGGNPE